MISRGVFRPSEIFGAYEYKNPVEKTVLTNQRTARLAL